MLCVCYEHVLWAYCVEVNHITIIESVTNENWLIGKSNSNDWSIQLWVHNHLKLTKIDGTETEYIFIKRETNVKCGEKLDKLKQLQSNNDRQTDTHTQTNQRKCENVRWLSNHNQNELFNQRAINVNCSLIPLYSSVEFWRFSAIALFKCKTITWTDIKTNANQLLSCTITNA